MQIEKVKGLIEVLNSDARNAMHAILGYLELVSDGTLDQDQRGYIEACREAADRHFRSIEDVRVILGLVPQKGPVLSNFAPGGLFARVVDVISIIAGRRGVGLLSNIDGSVPPVVSADLDRIGHTLLRMADGVISSLDEGEVHLTLGALASADGYNLTCEIFVPSRVLSAVLMEALHEKGADLNTSLSSGGALALAAARHLANALAGRVDASADASTGTRIVVTIPVGAPTGAVTPAQPGERHSPETQRALNILVAEDSDASFQLFKAYLQGQPHTLARATNGGEAVELAATGTFDLLFMDIRMPVMDGYAATRRIRELETGKDRPRMPIVVLSAEDLRAQRHQGALVGCSGHLSKPVRKHELLEAIGAYSNHTPEGL